VGPQSMPGWTSLATDPPPVPPRVTVSVWGEPADAGPDIAAAREVVVVTTSRIRAARPVIAPDGTRSGTASPQRPTWPA
jgi:hypothetical protein